MPSGAIEWIEFPAPRPEVLAAFYETVFGWEITEYHEPPFLFTDSTGRVRGGFTTNLNPMPEYGIMISITVDDIDATVADAERCGGEIVLERVDLPDGAGSFASIRDPAGNRVSLYQGDIAALGT